MAITMQALGRCSTSVPVSRSSVKPSLPSRSSRSFAQRARTIVVASAGEKSDAQGVLAQTVAWSTAASTFLAAGNVQAAQEIMDVAATDNRLGTLLLLGIPALGWVAYNMWGPATNQLDSMKRSVAIGAGLTAAGLLMANNAHAAAELMQLAESDGRLGIILTLFLPVVGWVGFNILGPAKNQFDKMSKAGIAGLGLASLFAAQNADAATELAQLAESDGRLGIILTLFLPVVGWVGYNIFGPAKNQLDNMQGSVAAGLGLLTLLYASNANAAEIAQISESDGRLGIILLLFLPVVGWVGFNILGPALNQFNNMKKGIVGGVGISAATLLLASQADAATEVMQLAGSDGRLGLILTLFLPVVGWVGFNILGPAKNQLDSMK